VRGKWGAGHSDTAYSAFGEPYAQSGTADVSFTGQDQDTTAGVYDFLYRKYDPAQSRWTSPDPAGLAAVSLSNPQSLNRYVYVLNNPLQLIDAAGLDACYYYATNDEAGLDDVEFVDTNTSAGECGASGGTYVPDVIDSITVTADPLPNGDGSGDVTLFGFDVNVLFGGASSSSLGQTAKALNQCAAQRTNKLYNTVLRNNKLANIALGNTFAAGSQLALGPTTQDRVEGGAGIALAGPQYPAGNIATQIGAQAIGRISVLGGTQIAAVPGSEVVLGGQTRFATEISRYTAIAVKDTPQFANFLGKVSSVFDGKLVADGLVYLGAEASCALGN
jgi:RHS repeat-associated protein